MRRDFNVEHGVHLPADICLNIENPPTRWDVVPLDGDVIETIPDIDDDLLTQVSRITLLDSFLDIEPCLFRQRMSSRRWKGLLMAVRACDIMPYDIFEYSGFRISPNNPIICIHLFESSCRCLLHLRS